MIFRPALFISAPAFGYGDAAITATPACQSEQLAATRLPFYFPSNPEVAIQSFLS